MKNFEIYYTTHTSTNRKVLASQEMNRAKRDESRSGRMGEGGNSCESGEGLEGESQPNSVR